MAKKLEVERGIGWGLAALIISIFSVLLIWVPFLGFFISIIALILSIVGIVRKSGRGMAIAGLIISIIAFIVGLAISLIWGSLILFLANISEQNVSSNNLIYEKGQKAVVDNISYFVESYEIAEKIYVPQTSLQSASEITPVGIFLIVNVTLENVGKETENIYSEKLRIIDDKNRSFDSDSIAENVFSSGFSFGTQLQPNLPIKIIKVFDLPKDAKGLRLQIQSHKFFSSSNPVEIKIGI